MGFVAGFEWQSARKRKAPILPKKEVQALRSNYAPQKRQTLIFF